MIKICYFLGDITTTGGIERVLSILTTEQVKDPDLDLTIVSKFHSYPKPNYYFDDKIKIVYLQEKAVNNSPGSFARLKQHFRSIPKIRRFYRNHQFDLILSQAFPNTFTLWIAGLDMKRVIGVEHVYYGYYGRIIRGIRHYVYKRLSQLVVLTSRYQPCFQGEGLTRVNIIANPVVLSNRSRSSLMNKKIISVGRLVYQKGFDTFVEIFKNIHVKYPDWSVEIYGRGILHDALQKQIDEAGLTNSFKLMGNTDQIEREYHSASIFVLPSRFEGFPMVLTEAMSQGLACVSFNCPNGPSDLILDESVGLLVENQNKTEFEKALFRLIEDVELRKLIGANAYANVKRFDVYNIISEWKMLYQRKL